MSRFLAGFLSGGLLLALVAFGAAVWRPLPPEGLVPVQGSEPAPVPEPVPEPVPTPEPVAVPEPEPAPEPAPGAEGPQDPLLDGPGPLAPRPEVAAPEPEPTPTPVPEAAPLPVNPPPPAPTPTPVPVPGGTPPPEAAAPVPPSSPEPAPVPEAGKPRILTPGGATLPVAPALVGAAPGVVQNRLPQAGAPVPAPGAALGQAGAGAEAEAPETPPLQRYAAPFANPEGKPLLAFVLIDAGLDAPTRAALAALPLPVTVALDPMRPDLGPVAAEYRAAGRELVMLATGLPAGGKASDLEVHFGEMARRFPEAVAVMSPAEGGFDKARAEAALVAPIVKAQGRGVLTWAAGLRAGAQEAEKAGAARGEIFADLGAVEGLALTRALDKAAFRAGQTGGVILTAPASPGLIASLAAWAAEGGAGGLALAPLSAALTPAR